jgi:hypothetical protein
MKYKAEREKELAERLNRLDANAYTAEGIRKREKRKRRR